MNSVHLLIIICSPLFQSCAGQAATLASSDSFIRYSPLIPSPQSILRFTFRTSELNGVLMYSEGCNRPDYLLVRLVNGSIEVQLSLREGLVESMTFGGPTPLNDNQPHIFAVYHNPQNLQFRYLLDDGSPLVEGYAAGLVPAFGIGGVFIGGAPPNTGENGIPTDLLNGTSFIGCMEDILFASSDISDVDVPSSTLLALVEVERGGEVRDGCTDPCSGVSCGAGRCVARWPDITICDCQGTGMLGETCSEGELTYTNTVEDHCGTSKCCSQFVGCCPYLREHEISDNRRGQTEYNTLCTK